MRTQFLSVTRCGCLRTGTCMQPTYFSRETSSTRSWLMLIFFMAGALNVVLIRHSFAAIGAKKRVAMIGRTHIRARHVCSSFSRGHVKSPNAIPMRLQNPLASTQKTHVCSTEDIVEVSQSKPQKSLNFPKKAKTFTTYKSLFFF